MEAHVLNLDKSRKLKYGFKALKAIKEKYGGKKSITDVLNVEIDEIPYFAWLGLIAEDESLTEERVEALLDEAIPEKYTIIGIVDVIADAIAEQVGVKKKAKTKVKKKKKTPSLRTVKSRTRSGSLQKKNSST